MTTMKNHETPQAVEAVALKAFNGGLVRVEDSKNPRGFTDYYRPLEAMRAAIAAITTPPPASNNWWNPEPGDPYWMLEVRQGFDDAGSWLKNAHSCLTTRDPAKGLRYPSRWHADVARQMLHGTNSGRFEATEHVWIAEPASNEHAELIARLKGVSSSNSVAVLCRQAADALQALSVATPREVESARDEEWFKRLEQSGILRDELSSLGWAFWPCGPDGKFIGFFDEQSLRKLAAELEKRNKPFWDAYNSSCTTLDQG